MSSSAKRRRSSSPFDARHVRRKGEEFSIMKHKKDVMSLFDSYNIEWDDFWKFAGKFEAVRRSRPDEDIARRIPLRLNITAGDLLKRVTTRILTLNRLEEIILMVEAYISFKQTEKMNKLQRLRKAQRELPVAVYEDRIVQLVKTENVVIIAGDTGCGKSTQIPQYLLRGADARIICTQPRRLACISLANRLKQETLTEFSKLVGYQIRFEKERNTDTKILFMTEGLLLRQLASDAELTGWDIAILDEVHERHLHADFLLGLLHCLLLKRPDFKLILMSATINIELFYNYFRGQAQILQVPGRLFPVELHYRPASAADARESRKSKINATPYLQILQIIQTKHSGEKGDVLIFLSGVSEISCLVDAIREYDRKDQHWIILPLHSALSLADQDRVFDFAPVGCRKCIVSTNIAETSLTIDGIRFVIDSGKVKEMSYDPVSRVQRLKEFWVSKSSAEQRRGRAGRTGPGICFRIYSQQEYDDMGDFATPEIKRVPLESVLLQVMAMGLPDVRKFPFLEPPNPEDVEHCVSSLKEQDALSADEKLTDTGRVLASLPVDIQVGKMLLMGSVFRQVENTLVLAAALSVPSPFTSIGARDLNCERERQGEESDLGDPITLVSLYREWLAVKSRKEDTRRWCRKRGLEEQRFYELTKLRGQFKDILTDSGLLEEPEEAPSTSEERRIRNGEIKLLKSLKNKASKKPARKELKQSFLDNMQEDDTGEVDIRDVEFRLRSDPSRIGQILKDINVTSHKDVTIARIVFCSGLYPQFAIADEFNTHKAELVFHTKRKSFVFLHPTSHFGKHTDILKIEEPDIVVPVNSIKYGSRLPFSSKHQVLCYLSMLETTKVYLTNILRMPALQTSLIFSKQIDTCFDFSKIVCDGWLLFEPLASRQAENLICRLLALRKLMTHAIDQKLSRSLKSRSDDVRKLTELLQDFLSTEIVYGIKRLLPADLKYLYTGTCDIEVCPNIFDKDFEAKPHERKGGVQVTDYLTYNCLIPNNGHDAYVSDLFECGVCGLSEEFNALQRLQHLAVCKQDSSVSSSKPVRTDPNQIEFNCGVCKATQFLTSIQILKHKKSCRAPF